MAVVSLAGCGLIDSSVADFKLRFPRHDFRVDSADWHLSGSGGTVPSVPCSTGCDAAAFCSASTCSADCDTGTQTCQAHVPITLRNDFDLATQAPEYQKIANQPFISVTIDEVYFDIVENTLTVATPPLSVYFGPATVTSPSDADAELVGTIDSLQPGFTGRRDVRFDDSGRQIMKRYMDDFHTPFRVLVSAELTVKAGVPLPMGRLVGSVQADAHAGID